jgi:Domain of unknown function (DUF397)
MSGRTVGEDHRSADLGLHWIKSSRSLSNGGCVEMTHLPGGQIGVRDSKNPEGGILRITSAGWHAFLAGARRGEFDSPGLS